MERWLAVPIIRYTQVGFEKGDEKKYESLVKEILQ